MDNEFLYSTEDIPLSNKIFIPYWEPPSFIPSTYSPYQILTSTNPTGSEGSLSQDSYLGKISAIKFKRFIRGKNKLIDISKYFRVS